MTKRSAWMGVLAAVVLGFGAFLWSGVRGGDDLDTAGATLVEQVRIERERRPIDAEAIRDLLGLCDAHPQADTHAAMIRARAWLEYLLGRPKRAFALIEANLGQGVTPEDQQLGALTLRQRHAEVGDAALAQRAAQLANEHFQASGDVGSLFLAWQMAVRADDTERIAQFAKVLDEAHGTTPQARLVRVLGGFPAKVEPSARAELEALEREFVEIPAELDLALAMLEIGGSTESIEAGRRRIEEVLRSFASSISARVLDAVAAFRLQQFDHAKRRLTELIALHPQHRDRRTWENLLQTVEAQQAAGGK